MTESVQNYPGLAGDGTLLAERNRVLRNTYWLLALSMVPTVLGAWIGVQTGIMRSMTGGVGLVVFLVGAFGFIFAIEKFKNSSAGVPIMVDGQCLGAVGVSGVKSSEDAQIARAGIAALQA